MRRLVSITNHTDFVTFKFGLLLFFIALTSTIQGQVVLDWAGQFGGTDTDFGSAVTVDDEGYVIGTGKFSGTGDFDPDPSGTFTLTANVGSPYLVKLDQSGNLIWAKTFSREQGNAVATDSSGNIFVVGECKVAYDFDPGPATFYVTSTDSDAGFLAKFDSAGNFLWAKAFGGGSCIPDAVEVDEAQNVYISGTFSGSNEDFSFGGPPVTMTSSGLRGFITKVSNDGNLIWTHSFGGSGTWCYDMALDQNANVYLTGSMNGTCDIDFGPAVNTISANDGAFIFKIDSSAAFVWIREFDDYCCSEMTGDALTIDPAGNVILVGTWNVIADFDPGPGTFFLEAEGTLIYSYDAYIVKLDPNGDFEWAGSMGSAPYDEAKDVYSDADGNIYTSIYADSQGTLLPFDVDPGPDTLYLENLAPCVVQKIDPSGNLVWARCFPTEGNAITGDSNGHIFATGFFEGEETNFALTLPGTYKIDSYSVGTSEDIYIMKLNQCDNMTYDTIDLTVCDMYITLDSINVFTTSGTYSDLYLNAQGCDSILTINLTVKESSYAYPNITQCGPYTSPLTGNYYPSSGSYYDIGTNSAGCDSVVQLDLIVIPVFSSSMSILACESYTVPSGAQTYFSSGFYHDTLTAVNGCDSILFIDLSVGSPTSSVIMVDACDSYTVPSGDSTYYVSGVYQDSLVSVHGCDSILTINLTIAVDTPNPITYTNGVLSSTLICDSYQWLNCTTGMIIPGAITENFTPATNGSFALWYTLNGCPYYSDCSMIQDVGIETSDLREISLHPNPADVFVNVVGLTKGTLFMTDVLGRVVFSAMIEDDVMTIPLDGLESGTYFVMVQNESGYLVGVTSMIRK